MLYIIFDTANALTSLWGEQAEILLTFEYNWRPQPVEFGRTANREFI